MRDVATKGDINELRKEIKGEIDGLRKEINYLKERTSKIESPVSLLIKVFMAVNVPVLMVIIGLLLKFLLVP